MLHSRMRVQARLFFRWARWCGLFGLVFSCLGLLACGTDGQKCTDNESCGTGFYCRTDGICKAGCRLSIECAAGKVCRSNQCIEVQKDEDQDGFPVPLDCDDKERLINPGVDEVCGNGKDDDCDGDIDEEGCIKVDCRPGESRDCYDGKESTLTFPGTRCRKGRQNCGSTGVWGDCQGQILPAPESCDNEDNDCNGKVDDGEDGKALSRKCYDGPIETRGRGVCKDGVELCSKGAWGKCEGEARPGTESCDGADNDCNGQVDDVKGVGEVCDTGKEGICKGGTQACDTKEKKVVCVADAAPETEICDNSKDDDCDGQVDDGCPYTPFKIADVRSFPHYIALSDKYAAISLRDTKKVLFYDLSGSAPQKHKEVDLPSAPHGIQLDGDTAYATTDGVLYEIDVSKGVATTLASFVGPSHEGALLLRSGRAYTRRAEPDGQNQKLHFCSTDVTAKTSTCVTLKDPVTKVGIGLVTTGVFALLFSDKGIHFVDAVQGKEDESQELKVAEGVEDMAIDDQTRQAVAISSSGGKVLIIDMANRMIGTTISLVDEAGKAQTPGRVVAADGFAYISHRDGRLVSVLDIASAKITKQVDVCLAPLGLALSAKPSKGGRTLWITCPGDNTIWTMTTEP